MYTATTIPLIYSSSGNCMHDLPALPSGFGFLMYTATKIPFMYSSSGNCAHDLSALQSGFVFFFNVHCNENPIYVSLSWKLRAWHPSPAIRICFFSLRWLPGEVMEPGTAHDLQPCNQDFFFSFFFFYCTVNCNENPIYVFLFRELPAWSPNPAIRIFTLQRKSHLSIPLLGIARAARRGRGTRYRAWSPALRSGIFFLLFFSFTLQYTAMKIPFMYSSSGNCPHDLPALQSGFSHCNENPIYVFLFWELHGLPGEVVEPGIAHDLQPCNQDFF